MKTVYAIMHTLRDLRKAITACPMGQAVVFERKI